MDAVKSSIRSTLPSLSEEELLVVVTKLQDDTGVECVADCSYVTSDDLTGMLKPIQVRKLLQSWNSGKLFVVLPDLLCHCCQLASSVMFHVITSVLS